VRGVAEVPIAAETSLALHGTTILPEHCGHLCMHLVFSTHARCKIFAAHCEHFSMAALPRTNSEQTTNNGNALSRGLRALLYACPCAVLSIYVAFVRHPAMHSTISIFSGLLCCWGWYDCHFWRYFGWCYVGCRVLGPFYMLLPPPTLFVPTRSRTVSPTGPPPLPRPFVFCFVTFPPSAVLFFTSLQSLQLLRCPSVSLPALRASGAGATTISGAFRGGAVAGAEFLALCICYCPPLSSMLVLGPCLLSITHAVPSSSSRFF